MKYHVRGSKDSLFAWVPKIFIIAILLGGLGGTVYFYKKYQALKSNPSASQQAATEEAKKLRYKVAQLIQLPKETPTVATVEDESKLKDQPFFNGTKKKDRILIFPAAKKAVIYRESENRIINVGPIAVTSNNKTVALVGSKAATEKAAREIGSLQGTSFSKTISEPSEKTLVFDVTGGNDTLVDKLVKQTRGTKIDALPNNKIAPTGANVVVFLAN